MSPWKTGNFLKPVGSTMWNESKYPVYPRLHPYFPMLASYNLINGINQLSFLWDARSPGIWCHLSPKRCAGTSKIWFVCWELGGKWDWLILAVLRSFLSNSIISCLEELFKKMIPKCIFSVAKNLSYLEHLQMVAWITSKEWIKRRWLFPIFS